MLNNISILLTQYSHADVESEKKIITVMIFNELTDMIETIIDCTNSSGDSIYILVSNHITILKTLVFNHNSEAGNNKIELDIDYFIWNLCCSFDLDRKNLMNYMKNIGYYE